MAKEAATAPARATKARLVLSLTMAAMKAPQKQSPAPVGPNGARLALYVALGVEEYVFSEGLTENILAGASKPDFVNTSWRDYGNRVGGFRLLDRFASRGITPAILLNTEVYDHAPDLLDAARAQGAEIVGHGLTNSDTLAGRSEPDEAAYLKEVADRIAAEEGAPPRGWSSPWLAQRSEPSTCSAKQATAMCSTFASTISRSG